MKRLLFFLFIILSTNCKAQKDTIVGEREYFFHCFRFGLGYQASPYTEIGYSYNYLTESEFMGGSAGVYGALEFNHTSTQKNNTTLVYGPKIGFETAWAIGMWAIEGKILTDGNESIPIVTMKVGVSLWGGANLLYGLSNSEVLDHFRNISRNQVSLTFNINRRYYKLLKGE